MPCRPLHLSNEPVSRRRPRATRSSSSRWSWLAEKRPTEGELPLPPTIQAVLAARLESLGPGERAVLERAAIVGKEFQLDEVLELLPPDARAPMPRHLQALVRKQFFRPSRSTVRGAEAFAFATS